MSADDGARGAPVPADVTGMSFEDALAELERIVRLLEEGGAKLDDAIGHYERGAALKRHCETKLREAQAKVDRIIPGPDGVSTQSMDGGGA